MWEPGILKLLLRNTEVSNEFIFVISKPENQGAHWDRIRESFGYVVAQYRLTS